MKNILKILGTNVLHCYCTLTSTNRLSSFLYVFACKQQLVEFLPLYFLLCFLPVLSFLCHFACSPSFFSFIYTAILYIEPVCTSLVCSLNIHTKLSD